MPYQNDPTVRGARGKRPASDLLVLVAGPSVVLQHVEAASPRFPGDQVHVRAEGTPDDAVSAGELDLVHGRLETGVGAWYVVVDAELVDEVPATDLLQLDELRRQIGQSDDLTGVQPGPQLLLDLSAGPPLLLAKLEAPRSPYERRHVLTVLPEYDARPRGHAALQLVQVLEAGELHVRLAVAACLLLVDGEVLLEVPVFSKA